MTTDTTRNELLIRHALTASVSALLAALVTAMVLGGARERPRDAAPAILSREAPRDDAALAEAIAEVKRAVERVEMGLELVRAESRRVAAARTRSPEKSERETPGPSPDSSGPPAAEPASTHFGKPRLAADSYGSEQALRDYHSRLDIASSGRAGARDSFAASYKLRSLGDFIEEFGDPSGFWTNNGQIILNWYAGDELGLEARFLDGYCVMIKPPDRGY